MGISRSAYYAAQQVKGAKPRRDLAADNVLVALMKQIRGMDMTKFIIDGLGCVYLVILLDWYTKKIVGWDMALRSKTAEWRRALDMAINREFPGGVRGQGLNLVSDNGSQPTSVAFMRSTAELGINQIFTSYNNPKGNADTERVIQTIKQELIWVNEFKGYEEALEKFRHWVEIDYNKLYLTKSWVIGVPRNLRPGIIRN